MEKILDDFIKQTFLKKIPLNKSQFAYQSGKSTITALHCLITKIEKSLKAKEISLCAFLDIEGAFDNASHSSMRKAMEFKDFDLCIINWIEAMLSDREISADLGGERLVIRPKRGCPQGGVLPPLLWSLVVDDLLRKLADLGFEVIGFADDICIIVRGKLGNLISSRMQSALNYTSKWCKKEGLEINPSKTVILPFTRRRTGSLPKLILNGVTIDFSSEVKYLGVTLDKKLNWNSHLNNMLDKRTNALWVCKKNAW